MFDKLNGYNETIVGMYADDGDLRVRARELFKLRPLHALKPTIAIQNTREQKDLYTQDNPLNALANPPLNYPVDWGKATVINTHGNELSTYDVWASNTTV